MKFTAEFIKSFLAGLVISVGGIIFLSCENKVIGACLFAVGLITVVLFSLSLYTGRIGYVLDNDKRFFAYTVLSIFGNLAGCAVAGLLKSPVGSVEAVAAAKLDKGLGDVFIDAIFCGLLIFICVDIYKKKDRIIGILFCIPVFILSGFEHSIADMFYFINARVFSAQSVLFIVIVVLGNAVGGLLFPAAFKLIRKSEG